jgi:pyridoxamine 5'-phosphate oxidase
MEDFSEKLKILRQEYLLAELDEKTVDHDPIKQFDMWFKEALGSGINDPSAMALATATSDGKPSVRMVLLKGYDQQGFVFYTNYDSRKGKELKKNPCASLVFFWPELQRQVRIEGVAKKLPAINSDKYFQSRPRGSQLGAAASPQSQVITGRKELEDNYHGLEIQYENKIIPRPPNWGGYVLKPSSIEFWQGRLNRLHDRLLFEKVNKAWMIVRLAP